MAASKADLFAEIVRREAEDAVNAVIAAAVSDGSGHAPALRQARSYIVNGIEIRLTRQYTLLEISDTFEWNRRKVGKQE
jgi:outer membrane receptor for Fe3+-dicitrate